MSEGRKSSSKVAASSAVRRKRPGSYHHGDLKRALMDATLALVVARGASGIKLVDICRAAGVTQAAFYRHFETREHLLAELVTEGFSRLTAMTQSEFARRRSSRATVLGGLRAYLGFARDHAGYLRLMFSRPPETGDFGVADTRSLKDFFAGAVCPVPARAKSATEAAFHRAWQAGDAAFGALVEGFARVAFREVEACPWKPADAPGVALGFWAMVHGVAVLSLEGQLGSDPWGRFNQNYVERWLVDPWLEGLGARAHQTKKS